MFSIKDTSHTGTLEEPGSIQFSHELEAGILTIFLDAVRPGVEPNQDVKWTLSGRAVLQTNSNAFIHTIPSLDLQQGRSKMFGCWANNSGREGAYNFDPEIPGDYWNCSIFTVSAEEDDDGSWLFFESTSFDFMKV